MEYHKYDVGDLLKVFKNLSRLNNKFVFRF